MENAAHVRTPMAINTKLGIDPSSQSYFIQKYDWLFVISYCWCVCARFQANPKMSPLTTVKRIIKYVNGTCDYGLFCSKESNVSLVRYFDVDWAGNADDRKKHY